MIPNAAAQAIHTEAIKTQEEFEKADFGTKAQFASAAAWSPNPKNPPFFLDLPTKDGQSQGLTLARWLANAPLAMVDQYIGNLRRYKAIAFDAGDQDAGIAGTVKMLDSILNRYDLPHTFGIYEGTHTSGVAERVEKNVPWGRAGGGVPAARLLWAAWRARNREAAARKARRRPASAELPDSVRRGGRWKRSGAAGSLRCLPNGPAAN